MYIHCTYDFPIHVVLHVLHVVCTVHSTCTGTGVPDGAVDGAVDDAVRLRALATAGHLMQLYQMRGMQLGCVYWLLAAIYLFAALGSVVASGNALPVQLAVSAPALLVAGPVAVGRAAECATEAAIDAVIGESKEWEDVVAVWCECR